MSRVSFSLWFASMLRVNLRLLPLFFQGVSKVWNGPLVGLPQVFRPPVAAVPCAWFPIRQTVICKPQYLAQAYTGTFSLVLALLNLWISIIYIELLILRYEYLTIAVV